VLDDDDDDDDDDEDLEYEIDDLGKAPKKSTTYLSEWSFEFFMTARRRRYQ
jgi:hypothetical protein